MTQQPSPRQLTRRQLIASGTALGAALIAGPGFVLHSGEAWAAEVAHLKPETFATLVVMARDIYPHDRLADKHYATAMKAHDSAEASGMVEAGVADLNSRAGGSYAAVSSEDDRVAILKAVENSDFFQAVRGGMITGLYNNQEVWPVFGYEGESFSKGGYMDRGFDDIDWL